MGTFLTFEFKHSLYCTYCGEKHTSIQYSGGGGGMDVFKIGDICESFKKNTIIQQQYYCKQRCNKDIFDYDLPKLFYIVIKDGKYLGVLPNRLDAEFLAEWDEDDYDFET